MEIRMNHTPRGRPPNSVPPGPATGDLYLVTDASRLYQVFTATGACIQVGADGAFTIPAGTAHGVDFNPTVDRLRIVSDTDGNLRVNPNTGVLVATDTALSYNAGDPNVGANPNIVAYAYSNNF